jgi:hypothetical protein
MTRSDVHRPSVINPDDYEFVCCEVVKIEGMGDVYFLQAEREAKARHMARTGGKYSQHEHGGNCHICGSANAIYTQLFWHKPTNTYVRAGSECSEKLDGGDMETFKLKVKHALELQTGKRKAQAICERDGYAAAWNLFTADEASLPKKADGSLYFEEQVIRDIIGKLVQYGSISTKQSEFVKKLLSDIPARAEREAARAAEAAAAKPVPVQETRMTVRGEIISIKKPVDYSPFPTRMLVKTAEGWKVWGSLPSSLRDAERGMFVQFDAMVKRSDKDEKFGFFSRPTKAVVITETKEG